MVLKCSCSCQRDQEIHKASEVSNIGHCHMWLGAFRCSHPDTRAFPSIWTLAFTVKLKTDPKTDALGVIVNYFEVSRT